MTSGWTNVARRIRVPMGFLFAAFFLWRARPSTASLAYSIFLVVPGLLLRAYASGYVKKNAMLTVTGPYAYTRNPLYLGSMMLAFGFAVASRSLWVAAVLGTLFAIIYVPTILSEEEFLRSRFSEFVDYSKRVPRFFPRLTPAQIGDADSGGFSGALYLKHREYNSILGACTIYAALIASRWLRH
jgi:protein-S-isoprenylcysteine O-methyltransferase Ste14